MATKPRARSQAQAATEQSQRTKQFKYRSIKSIHRKRIIEDKRLQLEGEHYQHSLEIEVLSMLNDGEEDEQLTEQRNNEIDQRNTRMEEIERQLAIYNDKMLDMAEEGDDEEAVTEWQLTQIRHKSWSLRQQTQEMPTQETQQVSDTFQYEEFRVDERLSLVKGRLRDLESQHYNKRLDMIVAEEGQADPILADVNKLETKINELREEEQGVEAQVESPPQ